MSKNLFFRSEFYAALFNGNGLARRLATSVILFSSLFTLIITLEQVYMDYAENMDIIEGNFQTVETSQLALMANNVWSQDDQQIQIQLEGLLQFPDMEYAAVSFDDKTKWSRGQKVSDNILQRFHPLVYEHRGQLQTIGTLEISVSLDNVYSRIVGHLVVQLINNGLKTFFVALFMLLMFQIMITRHLYRITRYVDNVDFSDRKQKALDLGRNLNSHKELDALERVVRSINTTRAKLISSYENLRESEKRLTEKTSNLEGVNWALQHEVVERTRIEEQLRLTSAVFEHTSEAIIITDANSKIIDCNQAYTDVTRYSLQEIRGSNPNIASSGHHDEAFFQEMWQMINDTGSWRGEIWDRRKNGEIYPKWLSINAVLNDEGDVSQYVGVFTDITKQKETERRLEELAFTDPLTGLANRQLFHVRLHHELTHAARKERKLALFFIDLDQFKEVNDTLGHHIGDEILQEVARRLQENVRKNDTVSRLGGDEFTIILTDLDSYKEVSNIAHKIIDMIKEPIILQGVEHIMGSSIGISLYPDDSIDAELLIRNADVAMYHAKEKGRGNFQFFSEKINQRNQQRRLMVNSLRRAINEDEFELYYQPQIDLLTGKMIGSEALVRWNDPQSGMIQPMDFIPLAEETGLILEIGTWVFKQACKQLRHCFDTGGTPVRIAINLSAVQFRDGNLIEMISSALNHEKLAPEWIELEITESAIMENADDAVLILEQLSALGIRISIDDFGTGYSSLYYLKKLPVDKLKIDKAFIDGLPDNKNDVILTSAMIKLASNLAIDVLAEGVETKEQAAFLKQNGCRFVQGYYYSKPLPADEFVKILSSIDHFEMHG